MVVEGVVTLEKTQGPTGLEKVGARQAEAEVSLAYNSQGSGQVAVLRDWQVGRFGQVSLDGATD